MIMHYCIQDSKILNIITIYMLLVTVIIIYSITYLNYKL